jgi:hypothetical protein
VFLLLVTLLSQAGYIQAQGDTVSREQLPYIGVYRLAATAFQDIAAATGAVYSPDIAHAGMNADGTLIAWSSFERSVSTVYLSDFEGAQIRSKTLDKTLGHIGDFRVARDRVILLASNNGIYGVDSGGSVYPLFAPNADIPMPRLIRVTEDGQRVYFVSEQGPNANDVYVIYGGQGQPQRVIDDRDIPCPGLKGCQSIWGLKALALSADGSTLATIVSGFHVKDEHGTLVSVAHNEVVVLSGDGYRYITDGRQRPSVF